MKDTVENASLVIPSSKLVAADSIEIASNIPDITYLGFGTYTILLAEVFKEVSIILPKEHAISIYWNYIDSVCVILQGLGQITKKSAQPYSDKAKGVTNIVGSISLICLTAVGFVTIGYITATVIGLIHSFYDIAFTTRCILDTKFREKDLLARIQQNKLESQMVGAEIKIFSNMQLTEGTTKKSVKDWILTRKQKRACELDADLPKLEFELNDNSRALSDRLRSDLKQNATYNVFWSATFVGLVFLLIPGLDLIGTILVAISLGLYLAVTAPKVKALFAEQEVAADVSNEDRLVEYNP